jgi:hypothetical protein
MEEALIHSAFLIGRKAKGQKWNSPGIVSVVKDVNELEALCLASFERHAERATLSGPLQLAQCDAIFTQPKLSSAELILRQNSSSVVVRDVTIQAGLLADTEPWFT